MTVNIPSPHIIDIPSKIGVDSFGDGRFFILKTLFSLMFLRIALGGVKEFLRLLGLLCENHWLIAISIAVFHFVLQLVRMHFIV